MSNNIRRRNFRKSDYLITYIVVALFLMMSMLPPRNMLEALMSLAIPPLIPALIIGTITNLVFRTK